MDINTNKITDRPSIVHDEYLEYLDNLRDSGITNMFGAAPYLMNAFDIDKPTARTVLDYWIKSFSERHPDSK